MATLNLATAPSLRAITERCQKCSTGRSVRTVIRGDSSHGTYTARYH